MRRWSFLAAIGACAMLAAADSGSGHPRSAARNSDAVPILMYHVIADPPAGAPYPELYVGGRAFRAQLAWLAAHGYHAVTLRQVVDHWQQDARLPSHPIVLTFDDGYRSQVVTALPALRHRGWPGVLNLTVRNTADFWGMPPAQARRLVAAGWEIDSHTLSHLDLPTLDDAALEREVAGSRARLRRMLGARAPVDFFCYPSGRVDGRVLAAVRKAGYAGATTTAYGLARPNHLYLLARIRINRSDGVAGLARKLSSLG